MLPTQKLFVLKIISRLWRFILFGVISFIIYKCVGESTDKLFQQLQQACMILLNKQLHNTLALES